MKKIFILFLFFAPFSLRSEIQTITVQWTSALCQPSCIKGLTKEFKKIKSLADLTIGPNTAVLYWKPTAPFSYYTVDRAMQMIGLSINQISIKVQGKISHTKTKVTLISSGDKTRFDLYGTIQPNPLQYTEKYNIASHPLSLSLRTQLLEIEKNDSLVTIEGPLFEPDRSPPLQLIVEKISVQKQKEDVKKKSYQL